MREVVGLEDVSFAYRPGLPVVQDVSLSIERGEFVALAGPNGAGKTTLLRLIVGLERPLAGEVRLFGAPLGSFHGWFRLAYLPQKAHLSVDVPATVEEVVSAGRAARTSIWGRLSAADQEAVGRAIELVGLSALGRRPLRSLSGGQQQRAFLAKALAGEPELLLLDEPTAGVDVEGQFALGELLEELNRRLALTVVFVSHEFGPVESLVRRLIVLRHRLVFDGLPSELPVGEHDPYHHHGHLWQG